MIDFNFNSVEQIYKSKAAFKKLKDAATKKGEYAGVLGPWQSLVSILLMALDPFHGDGRIIIHVVKHNICATLKMLKSKCEDVAGALEHFVK